MRCPEILLVMAGFAVATSVGQVVDAAENEGRSFVYLADSGALFFNVRVEIDGKSHLHAWHSFIDGLFNDLDRDSDGMLKHSEIPIPSQLSQLVGIVLQEQRSRANQEEETVPRKELSKHEWKTWLSRVAGEPLLVRIVGREQTGRVNTVREARQTKGTTLFEKLDRDGDGMLDRDDFVLSTSIRKSDLDDDETISRTELRPIENPYMRIPASSTSSRLGDESRLIDLDASSMSPSQVVRELIDKYDNQVQDRRLSQVEFTANARKFAAWDRDKNGYLDIDELVQVARKPQVTTVVVARLGRRGKSQPAVQIIVAEEPQTSEVTIRNESEDSTTLAVGKAQLMFRVDTRPGTSAFNNSIVIQQFMTVDTDKNGYLDAQEAEGNPAIKAAFTLMDGDNNEKVFQKEFMDYFNRIALAASSRTVLTVSDQGNQLFDVLDENRDGRLSSREFAAGQSKIADWDENEDQRIAKSEIPHQWRISVGRGSPSLTAVRVAFRSSSSAGSARPVNGPGWFAAMDRNLDGELTRREFLGTTVHFKSIDSNDDGVISAAEASRITE